MRLILTSIILTMLAQPVWSSEVATAEKFYGIETGKFAPLYDRQLCETVIENGVILGTSSSTISEAAEFISRTDTRIFFEGNLYSIVVIDRRNADHPTDVFVCLKFFPRKHPPDAPGG